MYFSTIAEIAAMLYVAIVLKINTCCNRNQLSHYACATTASILYPKMIRLLCMRASIIELVKFMRVNLIAVTIKYQFTSKKLIESLLGNVISTDSSGESETEEPNNASNENDVTFKFISIS